MPFSRTTDAPASSQDTKDVSDIDGAEIGYPEIDLNALAKKVYALFKQDARLERERLGKHQS